MSENRPEEQGIGDEQLPEDVRPSEDNPLAEPLPPGDTADLGVPRPGTDEWAEQHPDSKGGVPDPQADAGEQGADQDSGADSASGQPPA